MLYNNYITESKEARLLRIASGKPIPLHLFSKRVYRAYHNAWRLIDRRLLTQEEKEIMLKLGIYKPTREELGIPRYRSKETQICT
jgi:hypothetical protein